MATVHLYTRLAYFTPAFLELPKQRGTKSQEPPYLSPAPRGPKEGYATPVFSGGPKQRGQNRNRLPHRCLTSGDNSTQKRVNVVEVSKKV